MSYKLNLDKLDLNAHGFSFSGNLSDIWGQRVEVPEISQPNIVEASSAVKKVCKKRSVDTWELRRFENPPKVF